MLLFQLNLEDGGEPPVETSNPSRRVSLAIGLGLCLALVMLGVI